MSRMTKSQKTRRSSNYRDRYQDRRHFPQQEWPDELQREARQWLLARTPYHVETPDSPPRKFSLAEDAIIYCIDHGLTSEDIA